MLYPVLSGSKGNCVLFRYGSRCLMIDAGGTRQDILEGLSRLSVDIGSVSAILLTHGHTDHVKSVASLSATYHIPVYATEKAWLAFLGKVKHQAKIRLTRVEAPLRMTLPPLLHLEGVEIRHFEQSHDAWHTVGYTFTHAGKKHSVATDLGSVPDEVISILRGSDSILIECNYDEALIERSFRPREHLERVKADTGHLSNRQCAEALAAILARGRAATVILGHLSSDHNRPELACRTVQDTLAKAGFSAGRDYRLYVTRNGEINSLQEWEEN